MQADVPACAQVNIFLSELLEIKGYPIAIDDCAGEVAVFVANLYRHRSNWGTVVTRDLQHQCEHSKHSTTAPRQVYSNKDG